MRVELFGTTCTSPIFLCPTGGEKSFHMEGEVAVARAARRAARCNSLSTATSTRRRRDVNAALGRPVWVSARMPRARGRCASVCCRRVEAAGCSVGGAHRRQHDRAQQRNLRAPDRRTSVSAAHATRAVTAGSDRGAIGGFTTAST